MAEEGFKRKLAAILSADVEGYSRLMDDDEEATVLTLTSYRNAITDLVQQFRGRVVDAPGDNLLAEFTSVVDAVNCAVEIQRDLAERNTELAYNRQMQFRIGVNLGDVIEEDGRIYGDGVNIAARVESLAEAGGICISGRAHDQVENKLGLEYEDLGKHEVKNISRPIQVYRVLSLPGAAAHRVVQAKESLGRKWRKIAISAAVVVLIVGGLVVWQFYMRSPAIEPASVEKMAYPLPDKPSIAVLPFVNMSGDPEQEYIGDSIAENIITALAYIPEMFVIARTSTSVYKGKAVEVKQVSEELGVRYVLEGSIQKAGDRIRVTAQLIDAISGHHLWADRYDREMEDFFDVLDEIAKKVAIELQVKLTEGDIARNSHRTDNFEAWASATTGYSFVKFITRENVAKAKELFEKAVKLDPGYAFAWGGLGAVHLTYVAMGWSESPAKSFKLAVEYTDKALKIDETLTCATAVKGRLYGVQRQFEQAIATGKRAIALGPSHDLSYGHLSYVMFNAGNFRESSTLMKKAMRLNPHYPAWYLYVLARSYFHEGRYEKAVEAGNRVLARAQKGEFPPLFVHLGLSAAYIELGRREEANSHAAEVLRIFPQFSLEYYAKFDLYKNKTDFERYLESLRKAGIPDTPPLPLPDKPSIAVLAFDNLSGDPEQEYFSDGIAEDIITALSKTPKVFVIARNSSFTYKGKPVKVQQVGRDLGVRYVLEGSVRKIGNKVRITAQLIDSKTGHHLWAEKYDRELGDIFAVQDEITKKVILELHIKLTHGEQARIYSKGTDNIDAYLMAMQAQWYSYLWSKNRNLEARRLVEKAIVLAPDYAYGYRILGLTHVVDLFVGLSQSPKKSLVLAMDAYKKAISLDKSLASAYNGMGFVLTMLRKHDDAVSIGKKAIELEPNSADVLQGYAAILTYSGMVNEAIPLFREVRRLNPIPSNSYYHGFGHALRLSGKYEEAIALQRKAIKQEPDDIFSYLILGYSASLAGRDEEAQAAVKEILRIKPNFSVADLRAPFKDRTVLEQNCEAINKAGLSLNCDALRKTASK